jgi:ACT domain-containing protein
MEDCKLEIKLKDTPGALSQVLDIIAENKGNLFSVSHLREQAKDGEIPVVITLQASKSSFSGIIADLESSGIPIKEKRIGNIEEVEFTQQFILVGHIIDTDIKDTIYKISNKEVMVKSLDMSIKSLDDPSSTFMEIGAKSQDAMDKAINTLQSIAEKKKLFLIMGIE